MQHLRFCGDNASLEITLLQADEDPYLAVEVSSGGFSGRNDLHVFGPEFRAFCAALRSLEQSLRGEALLESMSPNELKLRFRCANGRGHIAIEGTTGYWVGFGESQFWHSVTFGFIVEPQQLTQAVAVPWVREG